MNQIKKIYCRAFQTVFKLAMPILPYKLAGIRKEDIPDLARYADKEANPLYPVPVLMDAKELQQLYYDVMEG